MNNRKSMTRLLGTAICFGMLLLHTASFAQTLYTGVVIDARGLGVMPSMSPKIYDKTGNEVYGTMTVDPDYVIEKGIAGFADSVESAIEEGIVGENPIVIQAISLADDPSRGSVVVRDKDALKILAANKVSAFFSNYKVAIIM